MIFAVKFLLQTIAEQSSESPSKRLKTDFVGGCQTASFYLNTLSVACCTLFWYFVTIVE